MLNGLEGKYSICSNSSQRWSKEKSVQAAGAQLYWNGCDRQKAASGLLWGLPEAMN